MLKDILVHIKYPYAAGVVVIVWIGTLTMYLMDRNLPIITMVIINSVLTALITRHAMN
jgi:hypothetical protein